MSWLTDGLIASAVITYVCTMAYFGIGTLDGMLTYRCSNCRNWQKKSGGVCAIVHGNNGFYLMRKTPISTNSDGHLITQPSNWCSWFWNAK